MNRPKRILCSLLSGALLTAPFAASAAQPAPNYVAVGKVSLIGSGGTGGGYITLEGSPILCSDAGSGREFGWYYQPGVSDHLIDSDGGKSLLAMLKAAKTASKVVKLYMKNAPGNWGCHIEYVEML